MSAISYTECQNVLENKIQIRKMSQTTNPVTGMASNETAHTM